MTEERKVKLKKTERKRKKERNINLKRWRKERK